MTDHEPDTEQTDPDQPGQDDPQPAQPTEQTDPSGAGDGTAHNATIQVEENN